MGVNSMDPQAMFRAWRARITAYDVVRVAAAAVLLTAAGLKAHQLATSPVLGDGFLDSRWVLIATVEFEIFFGLWLLANILPVWTRRAAIGLFALFAAVSLYKALTGHASCGCFGRVEVNPWWTFLLDAAIALSLLRWHLRDVVMLHNAHGRGVPRHHLFHLRTVAVVGSWSLISIPIIVAVWGYEPSVLAEDGVVRGDDEFVVLEPEEWMDKRFPLLSHIENGEELASGSWIVVIHRRDCPKCSEIVRSLKKDSHGEKVGCEADSIALVEVPGRDEYRREMRPEVVGVKTMTLDNGREWVVSTPVVLSVSDGVVTRVHTSRPGEEMPSVSTASSPSDKALSNRRHWVSDRMHSETACGPLSLLAVMDAMGVKIAADERSRILEASGDIGVSMLRLKELAEEHGLHTLGVEISPTHLKRLKLPAIVLVGDIGFCAVTGYTDGGVRVVSPTKSPRIIADEAFERHFGKSGKALLVSARPLAADELGIGPVKPDNLHLSRNVLTVGRIYQADWNGQITITNKSRREIRIDAVKPSCTCVVAELSRRALLPGESSTLLARGQQNRIGPFRYDIVMTTDLDDMRFIKVPVRGMYSPPVFFESSSLLVDNVLQGRGKEVEVPLHVAEGKDLTRIKFVVPEEAPMKASVVRSSSGQALAILHIHRDASVGLHRYPVLVRYGDDHIESQWQRLDLTAQVLPIVNTTPESFYILDSETSQKWWRQARVRVNGLLCEHARADMRWSVSWSDRRFAEAIQVSTSHSGGQTVSIKLLATEPRRVKSIVGAQANLEVKRQDGRTAKIHVFVGRESMLSMASSSEPAREIGGSERPMLNRQLGLNRCFSVFYLLSFL